MKKYVSVISFLLFSFLSFALPDLSNLDPREIIILSSREMKNSFVLVVEIGGEKYLIKQKKHTHKPLSAVKEALSAYVAKILNIAHQVEIIPPHVEFPGKVIPDWPATIHTFVEGISAHKYGKLRLKQYWKSFMNYQDRGLTADIIHDMSLHKQLPEIVALDSLIGNTDRHLHNLLYNLILHVFWAIDMDDTFNKDLCRFNYGKLKFIMKNLGRPFTYQELEGLRIYRDTLRKLLREHKPEAVQKKLLYFVKQAGIVPGSVFCQKGNIIGTIRYYEKMIRSSWKSAYKLISLLDKIVLMRSQNFYT